MKWNLNGLRLVAVAVVFSLLLTSGTRADTGGGVNCAACTLVFQVWLNYAQIHPQGIDYGLEEFCTLLPVVFEDPCITFLQQHGVELIELIAHGATGDDICNYLGVCTDAQCRLIPQQEAHDKLAAYERRLSDGDGDVQAWWQWTKAAAASRGFGAAHLTTNNSVVQWLLNEIDVIFDEHLPFDDLDEDKFGAAVNVFRGSDWRGRDCDNLSPEVYPGRQQTKLPASFDHNCNGISGAAANGTSWEELLCANSGQRGVIFLGDSATAHFRVPPQYINASEINKSTYKYMLFWLANELDWPHRSWGSGFKNDSTGDDSGPLESIYLQLRSRNLCNHRDFQNIGVNGARSGSMINIVKSMARNQKFDYPATVFYALIGNDVCHSEPTTAVMTTPEEFKANVLQALEYLDTVLPADSHVVFIGLVEGSLLWDVMHNRTNPIGTTYRNVYGFLNCLEISPCWGWLNSNYTVRKETDDRAKQLNQVYLEIIGNYTYTNFDMIYEDFPIEESLKFWLQAGGQAYELIEPVDGFHPSQIANALGGKFLFLNIMKQRPSVFGPVNPNNGLIEQLFGPELNGY